jgi:AraC-like DNA-binding protein
MHPAFTISQNVVAVSAQRPVRAVAFHVAAKVPPHDHEFCELCVVVAGRGIHQDATGRRAMRPGDVFITMPGQVHALTPLGGLRVWNIYYLAEWFMGDLETLRSEPRVLTTFFSHQLFGRAPKDQVSHVHLSPKIRQRVQEEIRQLSNEVTRPDASTLFLRGCFEKILFHLAATVPPNAIAEAAVTRKEIWQVIQRIDELLAAGQVFEPAVVAKGAHVGVDRLARIFKQHTGLTPFEYFQRRRLQLARRRLLNPDQSAAMIALSLGFADASHFGRDFRREFGLTPRQFRGLFAADKSS